MIDKPHGEDFLRLRRWLHANGVGCRVWNNEVRCPGAMSVVHGNAARKILAVWKLEAR